MNKVISPGIDAEVSRRVFVRVEFEDGRLSLTGVVGPYRSGNAAGGAGQINPVKVGKLDRFWTEEMVAKLNEVWERWHLNDMRAGTLAQEEWLRENRTRVSYPESQYFRDLTDLTVAKLNPDAGYTYGSAWLVEKVPAEVIEWLEGLPVTEEAYAWV